MAEAIQATGGTATSVAVLVGMSVVDSAGKPCGRVFELAVNVAEDGARVAALVLRRQVAGKEQTSLLPVSELQAGSAHDKVLRTTAEPTAAPDLDDFLLLERDLLDQQIIDVDGRKVVRVNDVNLAWQTEEGQNGERENGVAQGPRTLRITEVEVGMRGAARRLLKGLPAATVDAISGRFQARPIPWSCVDLIDRDPARRVRLKIGQDRLAKLHPSDIADILEELAPAEREAIFTSLPEETAAEDAGRDRAQNAVSAAAGIGLGTRGGHHRRDGPGRGGGPARRDVGRAERGHSGGNGAGRAA